MKVLSPFLSFLSTSYFLSIYYMLGIPSGASSVFFHVSLSPLCDCFLYQISSFPPPLCDLQTCFQGSSAISHLHDSHSAPLPREI